jgi:putative endonuclease
MRAEGTLLPYHVYLLASRKNGTLYVGVTNDLARRVHQHKMELADGFTKKYGVKMLVYCEAFEQVDHAIEREKRLKRWRRAWKIQLIERQNPDWRDLYEQILL